MPGLSVPGLADGLASLRPRLDSPLLTLQPRPFDMFLSIVFLLITSVLTGTLFVARSPPCCAALTLRPPGQSLARSATSTRSSRASNSSLVKVTT